jgi:hypothetical protein
MTNEEYLNRLNPQKKQLFIQFINELESLDWYVLITQSYRSIAFQNGLHNIDKRNSIGGYSSHNYGFAIDLNLQKGSLKLKKATDKKIWIDSGVVEIAKKYGLRWGGDFEGYYDPIHFDCIQPTYTRKWLAYLKKTYRNDYINFEANKTNWKFY